MKIIALLFIACIATSSFATFTALCKFQRGFGNGINGSSCADAFGDQCDAFEDFFKAIINVFDGKTTAFMNLAVEAWTYFKGFYEIFKECEIWTLFIEFWKNIISIFKTYPDRLESMKENLSCIYTSFKGKDYYETGNCMGDLFEDLFEKDYSR